MEGNKAPAEAPKGVTGPEQVKRPASVSAEDFTKELNNKLDNKQRIAQNIFVSFIKYPPSPTHEHNHISEGAGRRKAYFKV